MRVAIAGASGLIGHAVAAKLRAVGHEVVRLGRGADADARADLGATPAIDPAALAGCEALVHAAGVTDEDFAERAAAFAKATHGTAALLRAARAAGVRSLVYVSSAHVYGPLEGRLDELAPPNPLSDYALAHFVAEQQFRRAALEPGTSALVLRPCAVYGMPPSLERFARWSLIPFDFPRQAIAGRIVLRSHGLQRRNFVSADGLAGLVAGWLGSAPAAFTLANVPGPVECAVYEFAALCAKIATEECGREVAIERPAPQGPPPPPLEYRTRVGAPRPGMSLEDHVRGLVRALSAKAPS